MIIGDLPYIQEVKYVFDKSMILLNSQFKNSNSIHH